MRRTLVSLPVLFISLGMVVTPPPISSAARADRLNDSQVAAGLQESLFVSSDNAIVRIGRLDGFFRNPEVKIPLPRQLKPLGNGLRALGQERMVDDFVLSMNRAAEKAVPQAKRIFRGAIREVTFRDARNILFGGDTAVTDYFREKTSDELADAFLPIIESSMDDVGATRKYRDLSRKLQGIPFGRSTSFDVDRYVTDRALDGLFSVMAEEEKKIRRNPAKQVSNLIRVVFGQLNPRRLTR
jgi:hypothetical protein